MARCEDFPCCGHTLEEGCDPLPTGDDMLKDPARYHIGCDHNTGYCEYEDDGEDMETCSWCSTEVPDDDLEETDDGARICPECWTEYKDRTDINQPEEATT